VSISTLKRLEPLKYVLFNELKSFYSSSALLLKRKNEIKSRLGANHNPDVYERFSQKYPQFSKLKRAAVLIAISFDENNETYFTFTKRTENLSFSGQCCFPGGRIDPTDKDEIDTAYREADEECGIKRENLEFIAKLCPCITTSLILVTPVVAFFNKTNFVPLINKDEVELMFDLPTDRFISERDHSIKRIETKIGSYSVHYFDDIVQGQTITTWGLTAFMSMVISELIANRKPDFRLFDQLPPLTEKNFNATLEKFLKSICNNRNVKSDLNE
jgi:8-oxo-dGTP pyrophosphatase MutT (NUDIX family)